MTTARLAEDLAAAGVPVFACRPDKRPACPHGFKDAAVETATVRTLWCNYPGELIGRPTGPASGLNVVDIDPPHGGDRWWLANVHRIPATRMHRTRGDGLHILFGHAERVRNTASKIAPGVDTREGGYVVWWPAHGCALAEAPVAPWPGWLLRCLLHRRKQRKRGYIGPRTVLNGSDVAQRIAQSVFDRLAQAREGQRHYALRKAAYTIGGLLEHLPFDEADARERLLKAVEQAGAESLVGAEKTADWGLDCGKKAPLQLHDEVR